MFRICVHQRFLISSVSIWDVSARYCITPMVASNYFLHQVSYDTYAALSSGVTLPASSFVVCIYTQVMFVYMTHLHRKYVVITVMITDLYSTLETSHHNFLDVGIRGSTDRSSGFLKVILRRI